MKARSCRLILVACLCSCLPLTAASQDHSLARPTRPLAEALSGRAKLEYDAARILFDDDDYAGALVKFQNAFEYSGDVRLLWNMAVCEKSLRHYVRVLRLLERYRALGAAGMEDVERAEVDAALRTVRSLVSRVDLKVDQAGAEVFVDDVLQGTTPLPEQLLVDLGRRRIRIVKPHFKPKQFVHDFAGNSLASFDVHLQPELETGRLTVLADADGQIRIDGNLMGQGQWRGEVPAGEHALQVTAPGKVAYHRELVVGLGEERTLRVNLESESKAGPTVLWVGAGAVVVGGAAVLAYFLLKPADPPGATPGTLTPFTIDLP